MGKYVLGRRSSNAVRWVEQNMLGRRAHQRRHGRPSRDTKFLEAGGRLSLHGTIGTTVYYDPYVTDKLFLYDGARWLRKSFDSENTNVAPSENGVHDIFAYVDEDGVVALEAVKWASDVARSSQLTRQDGVYVKDDSGSEGEGDRYTRRYLGTVNRQESNSIHDSDSKRYVWNLYNQIPQMLHAKFGPSTIGSTGSWEEWTRVSWVQGLDDYAVSVSAHAFVPATYGVTINAAICLASRSTNEGAGDTTYLAFAGSHNADSNTVGFTGAVTRIQKSKGWQAARLMRIGIKAGGFYFGQINGTVLS